MNWSPRSDAGATVDPKAEVLLVVVLGPLPGQLFQVSQQIKTRHTTLCRVVEVAEQPPPALSCNYRYDHGLVGLLLCHGAVDIDPVVLPLFGHGPCLIAFLGILTSLKGIEV